MLVSIIHWIANIENHWRKYFFFQFHKLSVMKLYSLFQEQTDMSITGGGEHCVYLGNGSIRINLGGKWCFLYVRIPTIVLVDDTRQVWTAHSRHLLWMWIDTFFAVVIFESFRFPLMLLTIWWRLPGNNGLTDTPPSEAVLGPWKACIGG